MKSGLGWVWPPHKDEPLAGKVKSLESTMATIAQGLKAVSETVNHGFKNLAALNQSAPTQNSKKRIRLASTSDVEDSTDSEDSSAASMTGESDWDDIMARYDTAEKEVRKIAKGNFSPEKLYLCIPRDSDLCPEIQQESKDKLRWDDKAY